MYYVCWVSIHLYNSPAKQPSIVIIDNYNYIGQSFQVNNQYKDVQTKDVLQGLASGKDDLMPDHSFLLMKVTRSNCLLFAVYLCMTNTLNNDETISESFAIVAAKYFG